MPTGLTAARISPDSSGSRRNSEERIPKSGVIYVTLHPAQLDWAFHAIDGSVNDPGLDTCR